MLVVYIGSLVLLVVGRALHARPVSQQADDRADDRQPRSARSRRGTFVDVVLRSVGVAAGGDRAVLRHRPARWRSTSPRSPSPGAGAALVVAVLLPLWAGYLVKGYAWKAMLRPASEFGVDKSGGFLDVGVRVDAGVRLDRP